MMNMKSTVQSGRKSGVALIYALFAVLVAGGLIAVSMASAEIAHRNSRVKRYDTQAQYLAEGAVEATRQTRWAEISGRASALDARTGAVSVTPATETEFVATQPPGFANWRLIAANWMSSNALAFAAVFAFACTFFGLVTTGLLAKLGRHG